MPSADRTPQSAGPLGWGLAATAAAVGVLLARTPTLLTDSVECAGLGNLLAIATVRLLPSAPIGSVFGWTHIAFSMLALMLIWRLSLQLTGRTLIATAITLAIAFTTPLTPVLAPTSAAALAAAALAALLLLRAARSTGVARRRAGGQAVAGLAATAAFVPPLTAALSLTAAWQAWQAWADAPMSRRRYAAVLAAAGVAASAAIVTWLLPSTPAVVAHGGGSVLGCLLPRGFSVAMLATAITGTFDGAGLLLVALAALGLFGIRSGLPLTGPLASFALLPPTAALLANSPNPSILAPSLIAVWALAAVGVEHIGKRPHRLAFAVSVLLCILLPALQWSRWAGHAPDPRRQPAGHDRLSEESFSRVIAVLPPNSTLVDDGAATHLLARAVFASWQRAGKSFRRVGRDPDDIRQALADTRVFALPRAQQTLPHQGFVLDDTLRPTVAGLAEVRAGAPCTPLSNEWTTVASAGSTDGLALVALSESAAGPVVVYVGGPSPFVPSPMNWPERAHRGFVFQHFDMSMDGHREVLEREQHTDAAPLDATVFHSAYVLRLELWRVPGAPWVLPVRLGSVPAAGLARPLDLSTDPRLLICPSEDFQPGPLARNPTGSASDRSR
jgi:hypothetical protein